MHIMVCCYNLYKRLCTAYEISMQQSPEFYDFHPPFPRSISQNVLHFL